VAWPRTICQFGLGPGAGGACIWYNPSEKHLPKSQDRENGSRRGRGAARELATRLADFAASTTVAELSDLFADDIVDRPPSERSLHLHTGYNLVFRSGHFTSPVDADGATDWTQVTRIQVVVLEPRNA